MQVPRPTLPQTLRLIIVAEVTIFIGLVSYAHVHKPKTTRSELSATIIRATPPPQVEVLPKPVNARLPVRLKIPKINVDAALDYVGLNRQGDIDAPRGPANAAWYHESPRPGDSGNAIIDGHFGYLEHIPAVFDQLNQLQPGDTIYVEDEDGLNIVFVVRAVRTFSPNEDATVVFRPIDGKAHLNLITCQGSWNVSQKSYNTRLVVFADRRDT